MADKNIINKKLSYIADALADLKDALDHYHQNSKDQKLFYYAAQKKSEEVVESAISINRMILFEDYDKEVETYRKSFTELSLLEVFDESELSDLVKTAGFRNRLAHDYVHLDVDVTVKNMGEILKIYPNYVKKIIAYL